jgi:hypothetical protein
VLTIAVIWSIGRAQGLVLPVTDAAVLFAVILGVTLVPISIGGWGLRELAVISLLGNHGIAPERALLFSVCFGFVLAISSLPGRGGMALLCILALMAPRCARRMTASSCARCRMSGQNNAAITVQRLADGDWRLTKCAGVAPHANWFANAPCSSRRRAAATSYLSAASF